MPQVCRFYQSPGGCKFGGACSLTPCPPIVYLGLELDRDFGAEDAIGDEGEWEC